MSKQLTLLIAAVMVIALGCGSESPVVPSGDDGSTATVQRAKVADGVTTAPMAKNFVAVLSGEGAGTDSKGRGVAKFQVSADGASVSFRLIVANVENVTMAHIHISEDPGGNGPPAVWLYPSGPPPQEIPGRSDGVLAVGTFSADDFVGPLDGLTMQDLVMRIKMNRAYVNVHTTQNPPGEIRGQVR